MRSSDFRKLKVWQKAMELTEEVYGLIKIMPRSEVYGLTDQMRRAVISVPSNIAEGQGRESDKEHIHFISMAYGSLCELETQIEICKRMNFLDEEQISKSMGLIREVAKMLKALSIYLKSKV